MTEQTPAHPHAPGPDFDRTYWEQHWQDRPGSAGDTPPNPHLARELAGLTPGSALDAGCGEGAEALWLAGHGWQVTAADISAEALARAADRAAASGVADRVRWVEADLVSWVPDSAFDLVTTSYAHPVGPQLEFYDRLAGWVAPGGTLLVVGHLHAGHQGHSEPGHGEHDQPEHGHGHEQGDRPPAAATATAAAVTARLDPARWDVVTAEELQRSLAVPGGGTVVLHDVVVRAVRRS